VAPDITSQAQDVGRENCRRVSAEYSASPGNPYPPAPDETISTTAGVLGRKLHIHNPFPRTLAAITPPSTMPADGGITHERQSTQHALYTTHLWQSPSSSTREIYHNQNPGRLLRDRTINV